MDVEHTHTLVCLARPTARRAECRRWLRGWRLGRRGWWKTGETVTAMMAVAVMVACGGGGACGDAGSGACSGGKGKDAGRGRIFADEGGLTDEPWRVGRRRHLGHVLVVRCLAQIVGPLLLEH